jgi:hypothetical protein
MMFLWAWMANNVNQVGRQPAAPRLTDFPSPTCPTLYSFASVHTLCPRWAQSNYILWLKYGFGREAEFKYLLVRKQRTGFVVERKHTTTSCRSASTLN